MPKIRLSALASDIKGKAGGSVFSKNSGGTYFRNNPSGGGRKTENWAKSKAALSHISTLWRNLTQSERDAWNASNTNFPTVNAFGEPRTPSGYEVFMKLNTTLVNLNLPFQELPPSPRILPNYGTSELVTPNLFLFTPFNAFANYSQDIGTECAITANCPPGQTCINGTCVSPGDNPITIDRLTNMSTWKSFTFSAILNINVSQSLISPLTDSLVILTAGAGATTSYDIFLADISTFSPKLKCEFRAGLDIVEVEFYLNPDFFASDFRLTLQINFVDPLNSVLYINNELILAALTSGSGALSGLDELLVNFASNGVDSRTAMTIQDIRFYNEQLDSDQVDLVIRGYKLGLETIHYNTTPSGISAALTCSVDSDCPPDMECLAGDCYAIEPGGYLSTTFVNEGTIGLDSTMTAFIDYSINQVNVPIARLFSPSIKLSTQNNGLPNSRLIVNASAPSSNGVNGSYGLFKRIAVIDADSISKFEFGEQYIQTFQFIPFDSAMYFEFNTILTDTGQATPKADDKKKKTRFKAGADLSKH
jgi:hypothetical protein